MRIVLDVYTADLKVTPDLVIDALTEAIKEMKNNYEGYDHELIDKPTNVPPTNYMTRLKIGILPQTN